MGNFKIYFTFLLFLTFFSCGKNDENNEIQSKKKKENQHKPVVPKSSIPQQREHTFKTPIDSIKATKESVLRKQYYKRKHETVEEIENQAKETKNPATKSTSKSPSLPAPFVYLRKILDDCEIGVTMSQKELEENFKIPKEAMKLVKSVTKTAPDELDIKWKSTWLVEKVSDAKFNDGKLKMRFEKNKMYTSGSAIGIKYEKKMYTDLILIGRAAYIPSVKGFHWQIGND